ncbi:MAG: peptidylprolyl isomerase, partial [Candidatus Binatia bacterium]
VHVTEAEVRDRYQFDQEKLNLQFVRLSANDYISQVKITEEDIKKFYDRNKESLKEPLKVKVEYLTYPFEQFSRSAAVTDKDVEEFYQANRATKFSSPRQAKVLYILVALDQGADAKQKEVAQKRAKRIVSEARGGKNFAQLAKQESADPSSAKGGEIGWLTQGQMPPELDKQIFTLKKGETSEPIETPAGFNIVKVEDIKEEKTQSLQEATAEITRMVKIEKGKREAAKIADRDREKAASGGDLTQLAQESGVVIKDTRLFSSGEVLPEVGAVQEFYKTALSLTTKEVSPVIEGPAAYYVLKVTERKEPIVPALDAVRGNIEKGLKDSKAYELTMQKANTLLDQLKTEKDLPKIARANNLTVEETGWFSRTAPQLPKVGELQGVTAGSLAISAQKPIAEKVFTQKNSAFLFAFKDSQSADMEQFIKEKNSYMQQVLSENRQRILQKFKEDLKAKAKIEVHSGALEEI